MTGKKIVFEKLLLQGFGPYREAVEVHFQPGMNNLVLANERGKSTLVAGLTAVIFGLPALSDPAKFGIACYRNWENPVLCKGRLEFSVNEQRYSIERDFDSNQVCLARLGPDGEVQKILAEGTHNPRATKKHPVYARRIKEIFGLDSRELFTSTFCITQPLPELQGLSNEVQKLLSGGGVDFAGVLESLAEELKEWTKFTGDLGVTSRNQQKERELELLEEEMTALQDRLAQDRQAVDSLEKVQVELQKIEEESQQARRDWQSKKRVLEAWSEWRRLQSNYENAWRDYQRLSRACAEAAKIRADVEAAEEMLAKEYPELLPCGEETGRRLEEFNLWEEKKKGCEEDLAQVEGLQKKKEAEREGLAKERAKFPRWEELGADPRGQVGAARKNVLACRQEWAAFQEKLQKVAELDSLLSSEYGLLEQAFPEEEEALKNYAKIYAERERRQREAGEKLEKARHQREAQVQARRALEEKYQDLIPGIRGEEAEGEPPGGILDLDDEEEIEQKRDAARHKLAVLEQESRHEEKAARLKKNLQPPAALRLFSAAILAVVFALVAGALFPVDDSNFLQVIAVLAGGLAGYGGAGLLYGLWRAKDRAELLAATHELAACREEIFGLDDLLGSFSTAGPAQLGALLEKIKQFREEKAAWQVLKSRSPGAAELAGLEADFEQAAAAFQGFLTMMEKFTAVFPDPAEAYDRWQEILEERRRFQQKAETFAADTFGCAASQASGADPLAGATAALWRETASWLKIFFPERKCRTVADLLSCLGEIGVPEWEELEARAERYAAIASGIQKLDAELEAAALQLQEQEERRSGLQKECDKLGAELQAILAGAGGDLQEARKRWEACQSIRRDLGLKDAALQTLLNQYQATSLEKLKEKEREQELHVREHLSKWGAHIEAYPGLPKIEESKNIGDMIKSMENLAEEAQALEKRRTELQKKWETVRMQQLQLQGRDLINIAQAEIALSEMQKKKEDIKLLRDAIAVAHIELTAAIGDYQDSYLQYLEKMATEYYQQITRNKVRHITFDADFRVQVEEGGRLCEIAQLSKGAQDQLYLALRFAVADLLAENYRLPFIFDDPFVSSDGARLENIREILEEASAGRQFAVFSHNETFSDWGEPLQINI